MAKFKELTKEEKRIYEEQEWEERKDQIADKMVDMVVPNVVSSLHNYVTFGDYFYVRIDSKRQLERKAEVLELALKRIRKELKKFKEQGSDYKYEYRNPPFGTRKPDDKKNWR